MSAIRGKAVVNDGCVGRQLLTYEKRLDEARRDLAHICETIQLFEAATVSSGVKVY